MGKRRPAAAPRPSPAQPRRRLTIRTPLKTPSKQAARASKPYVSDFSVRDRFFKAHLNAVDVRYRGPGQCRHTHASQLLTTGTVPIDWIAEQMGHTNGSMIRQHYWKWIDEDGPDVIGTPQNALNL